VGLDEAWIKSRRPASGEVRKLDASYRQIGFTESRRPRRRRARQEREAGERPRWGRFGMRRTRLCRWHMSVPFAISFP
jgi:hypothetical protein